MKVYFLVALFLCGNSAAAQVFETRIDSASLGGTITVHPASTDTLEQFARIFGGLTEGAQVRFHANGNVRYVEVALSEGEERVVIEWFENGRMRSERIDRANGTRGHVKYWDETGRLRSFIELLHGKAEGHAQEWSESGAVIRDEVYRQSKLVKAKVKGPKM